MPPPAKPKPSHKLELTTNSLRNTTMSVENDTMFYEIVTRFWHPHLTKINKTNMETREVFTVAEIERKPDSEPRVRFGGENGQWMSAAQFVSYDPEHVGGTFVDDSDVTYRWKTHKGRLQLIKADDEDKTPVAEFHPHKRHFFVFRMSKHAYLEIKPLPEVTNALEKLIVSYLLVERRRRDTHIRVKFERS
ncbi:hypothetical protein BXZ70DRAFT_884832 [Cristinia sonorae]|uniref:DUF6593 domain-containing protein n=1 Tax=Cristinia sonorae TaxID=1940300 RepID=A0A8K0XUK9_9AGAR|nr:hypothetical protein BXZ70DRAFT_884832 [Cristinia sonorae]